VNDNTKIFKINSVKLQGGLLVAMRLSTICLYRLAEVLLWYVEYLAVEGRQRFYENRLFRLEDLRSDHIFITSLSIFWVLRGKKPMI
jgi:hypothetical protein